MVYRGALRSLTKLVHFTQRDYDVAKWTMDLSRPHHVEKCGQGAGPLNLYMFKSNNPLSNELDLKNYVTGMTCHLSWAVASRGVVVR